MKKEWEKNARIPLVVRDINFRAHDLPDKHVRLNDGSPRRQPNIDRREHTLLQRESQRARAECGLYVS